MIRAAIIAGVLAIGGAPAQAQLKPVTIEEVQVAARTGVAPLLTQEDAGRFADCGLPPIVPQSNAAIMDAVAEAKAAHVEISVVWMRHNLAAIAECLARPGNH
jgi:ABC-type nitrate/sulfonate/bicarbonate transport system substrate-binding protein